MNPTQPVKSYIGRFAPSPTGPLHLGSLYAALASFLQARSRQGQWLVRIDDLDIQRNVPGAAENILKTLEIFGLYWDSDVYYQNQNLESYHAALERLDKHLYRCICSRKTLNRYRREHPQITVYPGFCRNRKLAPELPHALRIKTTDSAVFFNDALQGGINQQLTTEHGDFIVKRRDRIIAYQLAVVVDDFQQNITQVVRGMDLLDSTVKQIFLQHRLDYPTPKYMHIPIITDRQGCKLSKQTFAEAVDIQKPGKILFHLLQLLAQNPPSELIHYPVEEILSWAISHWNPEPLKKIRALNPGID